MPQPWPAVGRTTVMLGGTDTDFFGVASASLDKLNATASGAALLTALADRRAGADGRPAFFVTIHKTTDGNQCAGLPAAGGDVRDGRSLLAQALIDGVGNIPLEIQNCLAAMGRDEAWLADAVNMTPVYNIRGMPSGSRSSLGLTALDVQNWLNGATVYPAPRATRREDLTLVLLTVLYPGMTRGTGLHSRVHWNPARSQITLTTGKVLAGDKAVSLAHELTHALYNGEGKQLGNENGHFSTVLFEYMAVGLGPWAGERCSENKYRANWTDPAPLAQRPCY